MNRILCAVLAGSLAACSYPVESPATDPAPVVSAYADKVPGKWVLVVDAARANVALQTSGTRCSQVDFPADLAQSFAGSAEATFKSVADDVHLADRPLSRDEMASGGYAGMVLLRVTDLHATVKTDGLIEASASAETDIEGAILVTKDGERMVDSTQSGKGSAERDTGLDCGGAASAASAASDAAVHDVIRKLAEQFANSHVVRYAAPGLAPQ